MGNQKAAPNVYWMLPYQQETSRCLTSIRHPAHHRLCRAQTPIVQTFELKCLFRRLPPHRPIRALARAYLLPWFLLSWQSSPLRFSVTETPSPPGQAMPRPASRLKITWPRLKMRPQPTWPQTLQFRHPKRLLRCPKQLRLNRLSQWLQSTPSGFTADMYRINGGHPRVSAIFLSGVSFC